MKLRNPFLARSGPPVSLNVRAARWGALATVLALAIMVWPVARGYLDGRRAAPGHAARADALIAAGRGADALGAVRFAQLLAVQDPGFADHAGLDLTTPGAGITTMTQSLAKRMGFDDFRPGWAKLRQTGLALGYESGMTKAQIAALWLETVEMGRVAGADSWTVGLWPAAERLHDAAPADLDDVAFADLVARMIAPATLGDDPEARAVRRGRILRLWTGTCAPDGPDDVWLEGCA